MALLAGDGELAGPLAGALTAAGWTVHTGTSVPDGVEQLDLVAYLAGAAGEWEQATGALTEALLLASGTQRLLEATAGGRAAFLTVSRLDGSLGLRGTELPGAVLGGLPGLVKTLAIEAPSLFCRSVDLAAGLDADRAVRLVMAELQDAEAGLAQVGYDTAGVRRTVTVQPASSAPAGPPVTPVTRDDLLVVTGGARGVTAACAIGLARRHAPGMLLLGRTPLADEPQWADGVPADKLRAVIAAQLKAAGGKPTPREVERIHRELIAQREIRTTMAELRQAGSGVEYLAVDVTDRAATAAALAPYRDRVTGLVHGAGVLADQLITDKQSEDVRRVLATKLDGLASVLAAVDVDALRHVVLFSSVAGFFGNRGQSDYAMANEALNRVACALRQRRPDARIASVNWGAWDGGMVTPQLAAMFAERGVPLIPLDAGVRLFVGEFDASHAAELPVLVAGPSAPLSVAEPSPLPAGGVVVRRQLGPVAADPVLADHAIGDSPVLPATAAIGAMLNVAERVLPWPVGELTGFGVLSGVVFDGAHPGELRFSVVPGQGGEVSVTATDPGGRPRYRARLGASGAADRVERLAELPALDAGEPASVYHDGALFHGPALRGITRVLADEPARLVLAAQLPAAVLVDGGYQVDSYQPVLADLLLQAALVWVHRRKGLPSLPTGVGAVERHAPLPDGQPFLMVVDRITDRDAAVRCTVTAAAPDGRVLLRFRDVDVVASAALTSKFTPAGAAGEASEERAA